MPRNNNYFEIRVNDHDIFPKEANLKLHDYNALNDTVTVSHYGERKRFILPAKIGVRRYNVPRKTMFVSFGYLFPN